MRNVYQEVRSFERYKDLECMERDITIEADRLDMCIRSVSLAANTTVTGFTVYHAIVVYEEIEMEDAVE